MRCGGGLDGGRKISIKWGTAEFGPEELRRQYPDSVHYLNGVC